MDWKKIWEASKWPTFIAVVITIIFILALESFDFFNSSANQSSLVMGWILIAICLTLYLGHNGVKKFGFNFSQVCLSAIMFSAILTPVLYYLALRPIYGGITISGIIFETLIYFICLAIPAVVFSLIGALVTKKLILPKKMATPAKKLK